MDADRDATTELRTEVDDDSDTSRRRGTPHELAGDDGDWRNVRVAMKTGGNSDDDDDGIRLGNVEAHQQLSTSVDDTDTPTVRTCSYEPLPDKHESCSHFTKYFRCTENIANSD